MGEVGVLWLADSQCPLVTSTWPYFQVPLVRSKLNLSRDPMQPYCTCAGCQSLCKACSAAIEEKTGEDIVGSPFFLFEKQEVAWAMEPYTPSCLHCEAATGRLRVGPDTLIQGILALWTPLNSTACGACTQWCKTARVTLVNPLPLPVPAPVHRSQAGCIYMHKDQAMDRMDTVAGTT